MWNKWDLIFKNQCGAIPVLVVVQSVELSEQVATLLQEVSPGLRDISLVLPGNKPQELVNLLLLP